MSAFGGKADINVRGIHFRFRPKADIGRPVPEPNSGYFRYTSLTRYHEAVEKYHAIEGGQQTLSNLAAYVTEIIQKGVKN